MAALNPLQRLVREGKHMKPCVDCGKAYPYYVMEYDHVPERGPKLFNLSAVRARHHTEAQVLDEIDKCQIVCSNCHSERTHSRSKVLGSGITDSRGAKSWANRVRSTTLTP